MDAIKAKDGEAAARRMGRHMGAYVVNVRHFDKKS
jgi:DNA-binding GntR family transcriptional regulator